MMRNHPEFVETMIAASITGCVFVPIDPRTRGEKLAYMLRDVAAAAASSAPTTASAQVDAVRARRARPASGSSPSKPARTPEPVSLRSDVDSLR